MTSKGYIHSTESFGSVDGPGIRFLIFLQGCHMRCRYYHNPDTWKIGSDGCGTTATVDELLEKAERYRSYWGPEGGITVSGGEALLQIDFLIDLFEEAHRRGINTCLDTAAQPFTREEPFFSAKAVVSPSTRSVLSVLSVVFAAVSLPVSFLVSDCFTAVLAAGVLSAVAGRFVFWLPLTNSSIALS